MKTNPNIVMTVRKSRHFLFSADFYLPTLLLILGTILFRVTDLDNAIQSRYFQAPASWTFTNLPLPKLIYTFGNIPAMLTSLAGLLLFFFSFSKARVLPYRKIGLYLVLAMILGPGLITNALLKDHWGRPRPRETTNFGGLYRYEAPLTYDSSSPGKSFPCGHATTGFYFFALAFVLRAKRRMASILVLLFAAIWGSVIGWIRIGMGGHFASDVLWAAAVVYLSSYLLFRLMKLDTKPFFKPMNLTAKKGLKPYQKLLFVVLGLAIVLGVLLATPYSAKRDFPISKELSTHSLSLELETASLRLQTGKNTFFTYQNNGFGFPGSKLKTKISYDNATFSFKQWKKGFFTELRCDAVLTLNPQTTDSLLLHITDGELLVPAAFADTLFVAERTKVTALAPEAPVIIKTAKPVNAMWLDVSRITIQF